MLDCADRTDRSHRRTVRSRRSAAVTSATRWERCPLSSDSRSDSARICLPCCFSWVPSLQRCRSSGRARTVRPAAAADCDPHEQLHCRGRGPSERRCAYGQHDSAGCDRFGRLGLAQFPRRRALVGRAHLLRWILNPPAGRGCRPRGRRPRVGDGVAPRGGPRAVDARSVLAVLDDVSEGVALAPVQSVDVDTGVRGIRASLRSRGSPAPAAVPGGRSRFRFPRAAAGRVRCASCRRSDTTQQDHCRAEG